MWAKSVHYLDHNAAAPYSLAVREKLKQWIDDSGWVMSNPSSRHRFGQKLERTLFDIQERVLTGFHAKTVDFSILWTSSGSEANQWALGALAEKSDEIWIGGLEHQASEEMFQVLKRQGKKVNWIPWDQEGLYDFAALKKSLSSDSKVVAVSFIWASNETGVVQDMSRYEGFVREQMEQGKRIITHVDAAQAVGKMKVTLEDSFVDVLTFSGHKVGALQGVGAAIYRKNLNFEYSLLPGDQQHGLRAGTENVLGILSLGAAIDEINPKDYWEKVFPLQRHLESRLREYPEKFKIFGNSAQRLPNTVRFSILGFEKYEQWVELLDLEGFLVSSGSACRSKIVEPSRVLLRMGASRGEALNSVRVSFGTDHSIQVVDAFFDALMRVFSRKLELKKEKGLA